MSSSSPKRVARRCALALSLLGALQTAGWTADAPCKLVKIVELPITMNGLRPSVTAGINGANVQFLLDSGAFFSSLSQASASELKLDTHDPPHDLYMRGAGGGRAEVSVATVKTFTLAGVPVKNVDFLVGGSEVGSGSVGLLGQNVLHIADADYDLGQGTVRLMKPLDCKKATLAYWASAGQPYSVISIDEGVAPNWHAIGTAYVNGVAIQALFDTGAATSILSTRAAARAGVQPDSPGVVSAGFSGGIGKVTYAIYIAPFASFKLGDEEIKNTKLPIGDIDLPDADMLIGSDFFLSHHIYVANSQHRLYFTYNGGPVFNLTARPSAEGSSSSAPASASTGQVSPTPGSEAAPSAGRDEEAADFSRRGAAATARGELDVAIADLTRACDLAPDHAEYFYQRGLALWRNKQPELALADFDRSIRAAPADAPSRIARAELLLWRADPDGAVADLDAADAAAPKEADIRYSIAQLYVKADRLDKAIRQFDWWIESHTVDLRYPAALNGRCWVRALQGQALPLALKDCNEAERSLQKTSPFFPQVLDSRGLVLLRMGNYRESIADYDASLKLNPQNPWSLYGRGIDELREKKVSEGQADIVRAEALSPHIADEFNRRGIAP
jgi:tetratricopeptide (TPR) repeat protein/predicted aspartyl protease